MAIKSGILMTFRVDGRSGRAFPVFASLPLSPSQNTEISWDLRGIFSSGLILFATIICPGFATVSLNTPINGCIIFEGHIQFVSRLRRIDELFTKPDRRYAASHELGKEVKLSIGTRSSPFGRRE